MPLTMSRIELTVAGQDVHKEIEPESPRQDGTEGDGLFVGSQTMEVSYGM
jgi:hypothetical protein